MNAIKGFFSILSKKEIILSKSRVIYIGAKYYFDQNKINYCKNKLLVALKYGNLKIKIKSFFLLIIIKFRNN